MTGAKKLRRHAAEQGSEQLFLIRQRFVHQRIHGCHSTLVFAQVKARAGFGGEHFVGDVERCHHGHAVSPGDFASALDFTHLFVQVGDRGHQLLALVVRAGNAVLPVEDGDVNIFGGFARCTTIATAIIEAGKEVGFNVPLVVRLEGTEVDEGRKMLAACDIDIINAADLTDAAEKIVAAAK